MLFVQSLHSNPSKEQRPFLVYEIIIIMRITSWVLLYLYPTFNLWKKRVIGTKFRIRAWFYLMKTIPKSEFLHFPWPTEYPPLLPGHSRPGAALARPCAAPARLRAAPPRGCARPAGGARLRRPSWLRLGGLRERERERVLGGERDFWEGGEIRVQMRREFLFTEKRNFFSDLNVRGASFAKRPPNNPNYH